ncbi:MAG: hypothetical protein ACPLRW_07945 [Moorellales bacterium]
MAEPRVAKYIRLTPLLAVALARAAQEAGVSENEIIIRALEAYLEEKDKKHQKE